MKKRAILGLVGPYLDHDSNHFCFIKINQYMYNIWVNTNVGVISFNVLYNNSYSDKCNQKNLITKYLLNIIAERVNEETLHFMVSWSWYKYFFAL